ncbi:MAG: alpha-amylase family protein [Candidatus Omnitrophota bacterium]
MEHWRLRQIHLDFHTSPRINDVGVEFDAEEFARTLSEANVGWVTLFAKCHHGMCYYPSKVGPQHPGLRFDLLGRQVEACRKRGIVTPAYISLRVDQHMGEKHPEWVTRLADGKLWGPAVFDAFWYQICLNHKEYIDYAEAMTEEVLKRYDVEGIFYDMCYYPPYPGCFCQTCLERMAKKGIDRKDEKTHWYQEFEVTREYTKRLASAIRKIKPKASVFFNSRLGPNIRHELDVYTHFEIEALPTGGWGYHYFPFWARFLRNFGKPTQGMTGKFHKSWADFGGLKTVDQLRFEAGTILATGSAVNVGDQLHPRGRLDKGTYQVIGTVFKEVKEKEPWCFNAKPLTEIAVIYLSRKKGEFLPDPNESTEGAARMLLELKSQFNVETSEGDLSKYRLLILPDTGVVDKNLRNKLTAFLKTGGSLIVSHQAGACPGMYQAGVDLESGEFTIPEIGVRYHDINPYQPSFLRLSDGKSGAGLFKETVLNRETDYVCYGASSLVEAEKGSTSYGRLVSSYFNRDYNHFTSHRHSPADKVMKKYPVAIKSGNIIYFAPELFTGYRQHGYWVYKSMVASALNVLLPDPLVKTRAPAGMEISLTAQANPKRIMVHLVNYQPQRRHTEIEYIETLWPVKDIEVAVRTAKKPAQVYLTPQKNRVPFVFNKGYTSFVVPEVSSHRIVVLEW